MTTHVGTQHVAPAALLLILPLLAPAQETAGTVARNTFLGLLKVSGDAPAVEPTVHGRTVGASDPSRRLMMYSPPSRRRK